MNERAAPEMHSAICGAPAACDELESALQWRAGALVNPRLIAHNSRSAAHKSNAAAPPTKFKQRKLLRETAGVDKIEGLNHNPSDTLARPGR